MKKFIGGLLIAATMLTPIAPVFAQARDGQQIAQRGDGNGNGGNRGNRGNRGQGDNRGGGDRAQRQQAPRPQAQPQMQRQQGQRQQVQRQQGQRPQGQQPQRRDWSGNRDGQVQRQQGQRPQVQRQQAPRQQGQRQDRNRGGYDRNNDGRVDRQWDRNGNGQVDRRYDRNRNGQVDRRYDRNDNNRGDHRYGNNRNGNWNRQWRDDRRYNWRDYRQQYGNRYRLGSYYSPYRNHRYTRFSIGFTLGSLYYGQRYWINDPWQYRLPPADGGYRWVRYYDDVLLVDTYSGEVVDVIYDFFW